MRTKTYLLTIFLTALYVNAYCQNDSSFISHAMGSLAKQMAISPIEKVYLQMDRSVYSTGDTAWFKGYSVSGQYHQLSTLSGVLHVELIDGKDSVVRRLKLPLVSGQAWGDIALGNIKEGNYRIKAYTNWMRNKGEDYFFDKNIIVVNATTNIVFTKNTLQPDGKTTVSKPVLIKAASDKVDVQFLPEGGSLVIDNNTTIAFKAVGADGLGVAIKGVITDEQNNELFTFSSKHAGMGKFELMPKNGKNYKARITYADGSENTVELPKASSSGYSLGIDHTGTDTLRIKVRYTPAVGEAGQSGAMSLIAQCGGFVYYAAKGKLGINSFIADIPKSMFPSGIVQFTLFSAAGEPMNERLVFIQNHDQLHLDLTGEQSYAPRQKVIIGLNAKDKDNKLVASSFSVAVTNEAIVPVNENEETTILSNLLLTSDLKGYIENPGYYFSSEDQNTQSDLDLLMLTQGYHRLEWKPILHNNFSPVTYQPERALSISGNLKAWGANKPVAGGKVTLFTKADGSFMLDTVSGNQGQFAFKNLAFYDSVKFVIQGRTAKGQKDVQITLDNPAGQSVGINKNAAGMPANITEGLLPFIQNSKTEHDVEIKYHFNNKVIQLKEVEIKANKVAKKTPIDNSANLNGPGKADQIITAEDFGVAPCRNLVDCLQGRLGGIRFVSTYPMAYRSASAGSGGIALEPMLIIINGVAQPQPNFAPSAPPPPPSILTEMNANDIATVEVLLNPAYTAIYGVNGGPGVLIITTKRGGSENGIQSNEPGIITYIAKGYYKANVFYSPKYDNPQNHIATPDLRSTIYWNPNIITGSDGKSSFEYFNADIKGIYRIVVEGIDAYGNLGRQVYRYKVE